MNKIKSTIVLFLIASLSLTGQTLVPSEAWPGLIPCISPSGENIGFFEQLPGNPSSVQIQNFTDEINFEDLGCGCWKWNYVCPNKLCQSCVDRVEVEFCIDPAQLTCFIKYTDENGVYSAFMPCENASFCTDGQTDVMIQINAPTGSTANTSCELETANGETIVFDQTGLLLIEDIEINLTGSQIITCESNCDLEETFDLIITECCEPIIAWQDEILDVTTDCSTIDVLLPSVICGECCTIEPSVLASITLDGVTTMQDVDLSCLGQTILNLPFEVCGFELNDVIDITIDISQSTVPGYSPDCDLSGLFTTMTHQITITQALLDGCECADPCETVTCRWQTRLDPIAGNGPRTPWDNDCSLIEICSNGLNDIRFQLMMPPYTGSGNCKITTSTGAEYIITNTQGYVFITNIFPSDSGTWSWVCHEGTSCEQSGTFEVVIIPCDIPCEITCSVSNQINNNCTNQMQGAFDVTVSNGTAPYTWELNGVSPFTSSNTTESFTGLEVGNYCVTITDDNGCESICCYEVINEETPPTIDCAWQTRVDPILGSGALTASNPDCSLIEICSNGLNDIRIQLTPPPYTGSGNCKVISPLGVETIITNTQGFVLLTDLTTNDSGTWTIICDENGICEQSFLFDIVIIPCCDITLNISGGNEFCTGQSLTLTANATGTGTITYSWSNGPTTSANTVTSGGTYTVTVTDGVGCSDTESITVTENSVTASITGNDEFCEDGSTDLTANPLGLSYQWSTGATTGTITVSNGTFYTVTVTDLNGCTDTASIGVIENQNPDITCNPTNGDCTNPSSITTTTIGVGGYSYLWSNGATTSSITGIADGAYSVTVTDANGCQGDCSASVVLSDDTPICVLDNTNIDCTTPLGSITSSVTGGSPGYTYSWSNGANTANISNLTTGNYTLIVTDSNGCTSSCSVEIIDESYDVAVFISGNSIFCEGESIQLGAGIGGVTPFVYNWSTGSTSPNTTVSTGGIVTLIVTDANGCTGSSSVTVIESPNPNCAVTTSDTSCGLDNGAAGANATGGAPPYSFNWSNGGNTQVINNLASGTYVVTVTDSNGCSNTCQNTVGNSFAVECSISAQQDPTCLGNDGIIVAQGLAGAPPYTYSWSSGQNTSTITGLTAGTYTLTVTDSDGCTDVCADVVLVSDLCGFNVNLNLPNCLAEYTSLTSACDEYTINTFVDGVLICSYNVQPGDTFHGCDLTGLTGAVTYTFVHDSDSSCDSSGGLGNIDCDGCECDFAFQSCLSDFSNYGDCDYAILTFRVNYCAGGSTFISGSSAGFYVPYGTGPACSPSTFYYDTSNMMDIVDNVVSLSCPDVEINISGSGPNMCVEVIDECQCLSSIVWALSTNRPVNGPCSQQCSFESNNISNPCGCQ